MDECADKEAKLELIAALRDVSEGKVSTIGSAIVVRLLRLWQIFVELERARLTKMLSEIREKEGKISEAADLLQEVQVEIVGTMEKKEKAEFLLEQIRLTMEKGDFIRVELLSKKVNQKLLQEEDFQV